MNEELVTVIKDSLEVGKIGFLQIADFAKEQAPILIEQILRWGLISNIFWALGSLIAFAGLMRWMIIDSREFMKDTQSKSLRYESDGGIWAIWITFGLIFFITFACTLFNVLKITFVPNLYIFEYIRSIISE